ncbi:hypothetical protein AVEN_4019-1 [Araneus ventricosus]|uniref:Uncharacterized protein n=1 Tax=Araneus ventricosus TaxID=182803 RepID=A0A4Y2QAK2_ARAVE|nr:hypothetical protein AVEN_27008-1 [Araneus ventricosus]GBN59316.1 hypothetical protein AVEN_4019-1 [Araneus ventricosus]
MNEEIQEREGQTQIAEQRRQEEIEQRKLEYEERKRKDEMEFELQKMRLEAENNLIEKLEDFDTLRSTFRSKQPRKEGHHDKRNSFKDDPAATINERKSCTVLHIIRGVSQNALTALILGTFPKDCPLPKPLITCRKCNKTGRKAKK